jgi:hypothetical protein
VFERPPGLYASCGGKPNVTANQRGDEAGLGGHLRSGVYSVWNMQLRECAVMFDYRKIALWIVMLLVPGGILLLPFLLADMRKQKNVLKAARGLSEDGPKAPNDGPDSRPRAPNDGTTPRLAA